MAAKAKEPLLFGTVQRTPEFLRISQLPRRVLDYDRATDLTPLFEKKKGGEFRLRPLQSVALIEAAEVGGLFCTGSVGSGKALICLLLAEALDAKRAVILTKAKLKRSMIRDAHNFYGKHLNLPFDRFEIVSYSQLSTAKGGGILEELQPDAIICDEAHCLKNRKSARTIRYLRYSRQRPYVKHAHLSGTAMRRSIQDVAHLIELSLGAGSPVPNDYHELLTWCGAVDLNPEWPSNPGMLRTFCEGGESVREGFQRRFFQTPGVVRDEGRDLIGASLVIRKLPLRLPPAVQRLVQGVETSWKLGDIEMKLALEQNKALTQLSQGFFYRWTWPHGKRDLEWLECRAAYHAEVRKRLKHPSPKMDSPFLLTRAAQRYWDWARGGKKGDKPASTWHSLTWPAWDAVRHRGKPATETIWVDEFLVDAAIAWGQKAEVGAIIWYSYRALGDRIAEKGGFPLYGAGADAELATAPVIVCSVAAQGTGKNLQHRYFQNLLTSVPPNGEIFQQLLGRTHRPGQEADEVTLDWFGTADNVSAMCEVTNEAKFQQEAMGERQKVLYATHL